MQETWVRFLGREDPLEKATATHSSTLTWKSQRRRSLVSYSPWGHKESDTTERLHFHFHFTGKGEKERYTHLNAEFQRIARRDKKAFLSDQCKETEKNNKMKKTRDIFKKIRDTKGGAW